MTKTFQIICRFVVCIGCVSCLFSGFSLAQAASGKPEAGVTSTSIRIGTFFPASGPVTEMGQASQAVLTSYFQEVNGNGGISGRKIELRVVGTGSTPAETAAILKKLATDTGIFAFVSGMSAGADKEIGAVMESEGVVLIGPATLSPQSKSPINRYVFYTLPGLREQALALVAFASARPGLKAARAAVVSPPDAFNTEVAQTIEQQAKKVGWNAITSEKYEPGDVKITDKVRELAAAKVEVVYFVGPGLDKFVGEAGKIAWFPVILTPGASSGPQLLEKTTLGFKDKIFLTFPSTPSDQTPSGLAEYRALAEKYTLPSKHVAAQISVLAAAKIFTQALRLTGKELTREKLILALESLKDYDTGLTPRLSYGPTRRIGVMGAYIISIDPERKAFVPVGGWTNVN